MGQSWDDKNSAGRKFRDHVRQIAKSLGGISQYGREKSVFFLCHLWNFCGIILMICILQRRYHKLGIFAIECQAMEAHILLEEKLLVVW